MSAENRTGSPLPMILLLIAAVAWFGSGPVGCRPSNPQDGEPTPVALRMLFAAFVPSPVMRSPLTTMPRRIAPRRIMSSSRNTPVSMPAHAFERSNARACGAPIACLIEYESGGSKRWVVPSM